MVSKIIPKFMIGAIGVMFFMIDIIFSLGWRLLAKNILNDTAEYHLNEFCRKNTRFREIHIILSLLVKMTLRLNMNIESH